MTVNKKSKSKHNKLTLVKKIGVTFMIPIFLAITGVIIVLISSWKYVFTIYDFGSKWFNKPMDAVGINDRASFMINNHNVFRPFYGEKFATIKIDSIGLEQPIFEGDDDVVLKKGIGHYRGSTLPGENGNVLLAGHRDMENSGFLELENISLGDEVVIATNWGKFHYKVSDIYITDPNDMNPGKISDTEKLTMYTCYPFNYLGSAPQRYIVVCEYVKVE